MKDFANILDTTLKQRIDSANQQKEIAEEIIEAAIKSFADSSVKKVYIGFKGTKIEISSYESLITTFSDLDHGEIVFNNIKQILSSEHFEAIDLVKRHINVLIPGGYDDIIIGLREDD